MKFLLTATIILSAGAALPAWADSNVPPNPSSTPSNNPPSLAPVSVDARDLTTTTVPGRSSAQPPDSDHLSDQAQQINRSLGTQQESSFDLKEFLNLDLPDGMIIRGGSRGGVGVGREF